MSAIALPFVTTNNAEVANPVNIERTVEFYPMTIKSGGVGTNPPDGALYSGYPRYTIKFKVALDQRTGNTTDAEWIYSDEATRDADLVLLIAETTTTL
jgi:hypothetical protein